MPTNHLYHTWIAQIRELQAGKRITQIRNFVWLMIGIYKSRSVQLSKVAGKIPGQAKLLSATRRLSRFLDNPAIQVREWYEPIARQWLNAQSSWLGQVRLIVDGSKIGCGHQLLMISIAYRRRAIPVAWTWVKHVRGHSTANKQLALLAYVRTLIPQKIPVFLVGDTEFGSVTVIKQLKKWHGFYALRQKTNTLVRVGRQTAWQAFATPIQKSGQSLWLGQGYLTQQSACPTNLLLYWQVGEKEPWCLATNLPDLSTALPYYKRRMWIEEMFGDMKKHGFDLESTMLHTFQRLSRLTLAVAYLYVWLISIGVRTIHTQ
ncbi:MAG: IS4 family transposase [Anaerolineales bacterium]